MGYIIYWNKYSMETEGMPQGQQQELWVKAVKERIKTMSGQERDARQVYATATGCQVRFSSTK
jgi:hypothetical protein